MKRKKINTHFTLETRTIIENLLNEGKSITEISILTNRDRSNIAREINRHKQCSFPSTFNNYHPCLKHDTCTSKSYECYLNCKNIEVKLCPKLTSSPHVCNGCTTKKNCRYVKYYYNAKEANLEYQNSWTNDRTGLHYTKEELSVLNNDFKMIVLNCKSVYHALIVINKRGFNFNIGTIYKQIEKDQLELKSSDLPRCRKKSKTKKIDTSYKRENIEGHTYEDYLLYKEQHEKAIVLQDTKERN